MPLEDAQAFLRAWNVNTQSYPSVWSTNGTGEQGQVFLYPIPGTASEMEWLCSCAPIDLNLDSDVEAIPRPYQDAVKYWAASRAFLASNRTGLASEMDKEFNNQTDLAKIIGLKSRTSEILNRKRKLTLDMVRQLHEKLHIPTDVLIQAY